MVPRGTFWVFFARASELRRQLWELPGSSEEQGVIVGIADFEATQTVVCVLKRLAEEDALIGEFRGKCVGIFNVDKCVPPLVGMTLVVWLGRNTAFRFNEDLRSVAADDGEEGVLIGRLEPCFETKLIAIKGDGSGDVADDEGWGDVPDFGTSHNLFLSKPDL